MPARGGPRSARLRDAVLSPRVLSLTEYATWPFGLSYHSALHIHVPLRRIQGNIPAMLGSSPLILVRDVPDACDSVPNLLGAALARACVSTCVCNDSSMSCFIWPSLLKSRLILYAQEGPSRLLSSEAGNGSSTSATEGYFVVEPFTSSAAQSPGAGSVGSTGNTRLFGERST
jgi:hypothetical protein